MAMFFPSTHPRLWRPCWNAWCQRALSDGERGVRTPMRRTFADGCASAEEQSAKSMALSARTVIFLFMFFPALSTRHSTLNTHLFSLDHLVCARQHVGRNHKTDLVGGLEINHQLKLHRLLDGKIRRLGPFENLVHISG